MTPISHAIGTDEELLCRFKEVLEGIMWQMDRHQLCEHDMERVEQIMKIKFDGNAYLPVVMGHVRLLRMAIEEHRRTITPVKVFKPLILQGRN